MPGIFVRLIDEAVEVWRPVEAVHLDGNVYQIAEQPYDRSIEKWEFEPGDEVICMPRESPEGRILVAVRFAHLSP
ncbi:MAG TPA: hypothetical protein VFW92_11645 [Candidatus Limnocylindrales bacterium]|nr:hypothetical protein [Candidatus Limnocylindrales bacterium]